VFPSPEDDTALTLLHEWEDEASFRGYTDSESFARSGEVLRPMMTGAPISRRFRAELVESVA
jgi:quinol monooxygenase YgiN